MSGYDHNQKHAQLVTCAQCGKQWYMTVPQPVCIACRWP